MLTRPIVPAGVVFADGEPPRSPTYGDLYHPRSGAAKQAREVFLAGNGLPARWAGCERFTILETGFGLGNNFLAAWQAWRDDPLRCARLDFVSIEAHPLTQADLARAHTGGHWPALAQELLRCWPPLVPGLHRLDFDGGRVRLLLALGAAQRLVPLLRLHADAVFLDGFAPARNADMWERRLLKMLAHRCAPDATAATWSVAASLRQAMTAAGFEVHKHPGSGGKREVLRAALRPRLHPRPPPAGQTFEQREALVVGAGLAGAWVADALRGEGWPVTVLERRSEPAAETSGNPAGIFHGVVHAEDGLHARLFRAAALFAARRLRPWIDGGVVTGQLRGLLRLSDEPVVGMHTLVERQGLPRDWVQVLSRTDASRLAGRPMPSAAWLFPGGGWVSPRELVRALLAQPGVHFRGGQAVARIARAQGSWQAMDAEGRVIAQAPVLVLANAAEAMTLAAEHAEAAWPVASQAGELFTLSSRARPPTIPVAGGGYLIAEPPDAGGRLWAGGGWLQRLAGHAPDHIVESRAGQRLQTPNRLPIVGPLTLTAATMPRGARVDQARLLPRCRGLFTATAFGSRGLTLAPLAGALLAAQITGAPLPLEQDLVDALDPGRFLVKAARRAPANAGA